MKAKTFESLIRKVVREEIDYALGRELKSLKEYFFAFRSQVYSYERIINVIYNDMMDAYDPQRLRLVMVCNPRGGISSKLTADSDWSARGGNENFKDWVGQLEEW